MMIKKRYYVEWSLELEDIARIICLEVPNTHMEIIEMDMAYIESYALPREHEWIEFMLSLL